MADIEQHKVRLSEAKRYINHASVKRKRPVFIWGPPGVGKSDVVESIVTDAINAGKTAKLYDMRLSMCEPTDIMGIPYFDSEERTMRWAPPSSLSALPRLLWALAKSGLRASAFWKLAIASSSLPKS